MYQLLWKHISVSCLYENNKMWGRQGASFINTISSAEESKLSAALWATAIQDSKHQRQGFWSENRLRTKFLTLPQGWPKLFNGAVCDGQPGLIAVKFSTLLLIMSE